MHLNVTLGKLLVYFLQPWKYVANETTVYLVFDALILYNTDSLFGFISQEDSCTPLK